MNNILLFPWSESWLIYTAILGFVGIMLVLDLGVFHRTAHKVKMKEAAGWTVFWISLALVANYLFYRYALYTFQTAPRFSGMLNPEAEATRVGMEFLTGFLIEKALAVDNIFVFVMVFSALGIPAIYQHRVLFFGILGAVFFRAVFIALGSSLMAYHWIVVGLGVFLVLTGLRMLFMEQAPVNLEKNGMIRFLRKLIPLTTEFTGQRFFVRKNGAIVGTPLLVALLMIELTDIVFAVDSVPAIFAITKEPLIVFGSNIFAIMGLRSLYFLLADIVDRFIYLKVGLALVLVFVGLKMSWLNGAMGGKFPISWSLGVIGALVFGSIAASLWATRNGKKR